MFSSNTSAANGAANYIEDVFSTYVWPTTTAPNTVVNGIDLATKGGMVWTKLRNSADNNRIWDSARGPTKRLITDATAAQVDEGIYGQVFNTNGFTDRWFGSGYNAVSWTFRKQPKFFDVVTYTGNGLDRTIAHSLGSVPGCVIVKCTSSGGSATYNWVVWHRSLASNEYLQLNTTDQKFSGASVFNTTAVPNTSTTFSVGTNAITNQSGQTYVAYLFAHDAGGFGLTGTDNVISCGSYTGTGSAQDINLGYEPQFLIIKNATTGSTNWVMLDNMRGLPVGTGDAYLKPNLSDAEVATSDFVDPTATGFRTILSTMNTSGNTFIYIAIRRGPMKVPTSGTSVFNPALEWTPNSNIMGYLGAPADMEWIGYRNGASINVNARTRLTGGNRLSTSSTAAEIADSTNYWDNQLGFNQTAGTPTSIYAMWTGRRAPSFLDVVCYTGTGVARTVTHNLAAVPELIIIKNRGAVDSWYTYNANIGNTKYLLLNSTAASATSSATWNNTSPTSTVFTVNTETGVNYSANTYVAYLFATCAGVSKVGSYTGTGTTLQIDCGFASGARFVLIKRTDSTGSWYVWDTARGIVSGNDPYLLLNSANAEVTNTDYVDTYSAGFEISSTAPAAINASGGTFIFLAIA